MIILSFSVSAIGTIQTDKENYNVGETGIVSGSCTLGNEKNVDGYFVWYNLTGGLPIVFRNVSVNTGNCIGGLFTDSHTFSHVFIGSVNFTTTDINWNDANDVIGDNFSVALPDFINCLISDIKGNDNNITIGELNAVKFTVLDAKTNTPLVNVRCTADGYSVLSTPLVFEPYNANSYYRYTGSNGEVGFQRVMSEQFWTTDTTYLYEFHCECLNNTDSACYFENSGGNAGFKTCTASVPFTTNNFDLREVEKVDANNFFIYLGFMALTFLLFLGIHTNIHSDNDKKDNGTAYFYGLLGGGVQFLLAGAIISGFKPVDSSITFMFDLNYYLSLISLILGLFSIFYGFSVSDNRDTQRDAEEGF